jgi:hypothetical protein
LGLSQKRLPLFAIKINSSGMHSAFISTLMRVNGTKLEEKLTIHVTVTVVPALILRVGTSFSVLRSEIVPRVTMKSPPFFF